MTRIAKHKVLIIPDIHFPEQDERALNIIWQVLYETEFDEVIQLGDMLDMYSLSTFTKDPKKFGEGLEMELKLAKEFLRKVRKSQPGAKITLLKGNHEARFEKYIFDKAPALARLVDYRTMLDLDKLRIQYVDGMYTIGKIHFMHGIFATANATKKHFDKFTQSLIIGHTHRLSSYYKTTLDTTFTVQEMGCLCNLKPDYMKDKGVADWQQAFGIMYVDKKSGWFMNVSFPIVNYKTIYKDRLLRG